MRPPLPRRWTRQALPRSVARRIRAQETPKRSGTLKWTLGCVVSWALVAVFIAVVLAWSI